MRKEFLVMAVLGCAGVCRTLGSSAVGAVTPVERTDSTAVGTDSRALSSTDVDADSTAGGEAERGLMLKEVEVLAQTRKNDGSTAYVLNRLALDHHQMLNVAGISALLPGGKTVNPTLTDDGRLGLRSSALERGNATFGTAIEVDGMRLDNNGMMSETAGVSTRGISASNIESVEVIAGIPSVEYGDISNGVVKVNTRRGSSPFIIEGSINPYTRQISLNKGVSIAGVGTLNASVEHARSYTSVTSPHTGYQRNALSLTYARAVDIGKSTLSLKAMVSGNIGGYNSKADPDAFADTYQKVRDNQLRANLSLSWIGHTGTGLLRTDLSAAFSATDRLTEDYTNKSSSSPQPALRATESGYYMAGAGPTGYWYERSYHDQKPQSLQLKWKGALTAGRNSLLAGVEYRMSRNNGRGQYYEDLSLAPGWRPYRYDLLPAMRVLSVFAEDRFTAGRLQLTAGLRQELTPKAVLSPRLKATYAFPAGSARALATTLHAGWGRSVKLPSFQILYPAAAYLDKLAFATGATADNTTYYAYNTYVSEAVRNPGLRWQHTDQLEAGVEAGWRGARLSLTCFLQKTRHPYQQVNVYTPVSYRYTPQSALEGLDIPAADRLYSIDAQSGVVTVTPASGGESVQLPYITHYTYNHNSMYVNGSPVTRYGLEWILDLPKLYAGTSSLALRLDGSWYRYKGLDRTLFAGVPNGVGDTTGPEGEGPSVGLPVIGYYLGSSATSASTAATPSVSNGTRSEQCNLNSTLTLHIPRVRFIATLRLESTLLNTRRQLANADAPAGHPLYYSTWDDPGRLLPYDPAEAPGLVKLTPTDYYFDARSLSPYCSANISLTKEVGAWLSVSFYANNFLNSMRHVRDSQTGLWQSLYNSGLIPGFYYGMSLRLKI